MRAILLPVFFLIIHLAAAQRVIPLYLNGVPNARAVPDQEVNNAGQVVLNVSTPTLTVYTPPTPNGTAVIICPGGGYGALVIKREGYEVAEAFNKMGITAFVLKYRLPNDKTMVDKSIGPLQDAQQAIKLVRQRAAEWHVDVAKIGIVGFSAGGHLAATAGTHSERAMIDNSENVNLRPDFMILVYPVISFTDSLGHSGSRKNLLGESPSADQIKLYSNELQVTKQTPPAFLLHAGDDRIVSVENSLAFYEALHRHEVPAGMHIYPAGDHGFLNTPTRDEWMNLCKSWLQANGWLNK
ncbi:alpha/beta hydrolase [Spirosoma sp. KNUC1025]|uniref:alpha/beta hydrolase n=1 Tax=Spirosoma sp. KNUC1025 TaxID=2894082 RepID=UPI003868959D|nr:alpha/beta hydrolase [Spirosoma sp. KNUC1025]